MRSSRNKDKNCPKGYESQLKLVKQAQVREKGETLRNQVLRWEL